VLFDAEHTSDNNYQNGMRDLVTNTIVPMLSSVRDRLNGWLLPRFGLEGTHYLDFDISGLPEMQRDMEKLTNSLAKSYWLTEDEKRMEQGHEAKGGAFDQAHAPSGLTPLDMLGMDVPMDPAADPNDHPNVAY
jgi:phage portal protein BeeE